MKLLLVRHGQTEWNQLNKMQGQKDSPLTGRGRLQAELAGRALSACHVTHFFCSDAGRAVETVEQIVKANAGLPAPRQDPRLRELNYGDWEGLVRKEIEDGYADLFRTYKRNPEHFRAPNGESFQDVQHRFLSLLAEIPRGDGETCLIVTHGGLIRVALLALTNRGLHELPALPLIREASITSLEWAHGGWTVLGLGQTEHLDGLSA